MTDTLIILTSFAAGVIANTDLIKFSTKLIKFSTKLFAKTEAEAKTVETDATAEVKTVETDIAAKL